MQCWWRQERGRKVLPNPHDAAVLGRLLSVLRLAMLWLIVGCGSPSAPPPAQLGTAEQGEPCEQSAECASGVCVRADANRGICSSNCSTDSDCPQSSNWACLPASSGSAHVCGCRPLSDHEVCGDGLDNDCNGKIDDCSACADGLSACGDQCVDTSSSASDCGACGHACQPGETCVDGECSCPDGNVSCGDAGCVVLDSDVNHCGECGVGCQMGQTCADGKCSCAAAEAPDFCDAVGCVNLQQDAKHCGACGTACAKGQVCNGGECGCPAGKKVCDGACVALDRDEANCGECGQACGAAQTCIQGSCGCDTDGYTTCGGDCANLATDAAHCGSCDNACKQGEQCAAGSCACASQLYCDGVCMDAADDANCGQCGHACSAGQICSKGSCVCDGLGLSSCGDACVDFKADESNCGACGNACRAGEQCYVGVCQCPLGQQFCESAGKCVNLLSDLQNCGACGTSCDPTQLCSLGSCRCQASGALYCASESSCVDTVKNLAHCGGCDQACKPTETCNGGKCSCPAYGQAYCASTNACTDLLSNAQHCGACDTACRSGEICTEGQCRCPMYQEWCDVAKRCIDSTNDAKNCGACGNACGGAQHCTWSVCECDDASLSVCGGTCYDLQTTEQHCGDCNTVCGAALSCKAGACRCDNPTPGSEVRVNNDTNDNWQLEATWDGANVGVVYRTAAAADIKQDVGNNVRFTRIKPDGTPLNTIQLTNFGSTVRGVVEPPHVAWNGSEYAVQWVQDTNAGGLPQVMFRRVKASGTPAAGAVVVVKSGGTYPNQFRAQTGGLAWSAKYGGYGAYYTKEGTFMYSAFRRLGADATTPEAETTFDELSRGVASVRMASAPDGTWGIQAGVFQLIDADGSRTQPAVGLLGQDYFYAPPLIHDGKAFVTVGRERIGTTSYWGLYLNRGNTRNDPALLFTEPDLTQVYTEAVLAKAGESIALGYGTFVPKTDFEHFSLQRYTIPATLSSAVTPLHDPVDIVTTNNISRYGGDIALVATTPGHMLALWADSRSGNRQLYARDIDLHACP